MVLHLTRGRTSRHAKLLYNHLLQIERMDALFDKVSSILSTFGREQGNLYFPRFSDLLGPQGSQSWRCGVSLYT